MFSLFLPLSDWSQDSDSYWLGIYNQKHLSLPQSHEGLICTSECIWLSSMTLRNIKLLSLGSKDLTVSHRNGLTSFL